MSEDDSLREEIEQMFAEETRKRVAKPTRKYPSYSKDRDDWADFCPDGGAVHLAELWDIKQAQEAKGIAHKVRKLRKK